MLLWRLWDKAKTEDISVFSEYYGENFTKLYIESHLNELKGMKQRI